MIKSKSSKEIQIDNDPESEYSTLCDTPTNSSPNSANASTETQSPTMVNSSTQNENSTMVNPSIQSSSFQRIENFQKIPKYKMSHPRRGLAIVFNHKIFDKLTQRNGTNIDRESISTSLTKLQFEVRIHDDKCAKEISEILEKVRNENHYDADSLCVVVLSHGDEDNVCAKDGPYETKKLWQPFTADQCPSLAGKPKWFIFQVSFFWATL